MIVYVVILTLLLQCGQSWVMRPQVRLLANARALRPKLRPIATVWHPSRLLDTSADDPLPVDPLMATLDRLQDQASQLAKTLHANETETAAALKDLLLTKSRALASSFNATTDGGRGEGWLVYMGLFMWWAVAGEPAAVQRLVRLGGVACALSGIGITASAVLRWFKQLDGALVTTGMHSIVRHPLYFGMLLYAVGAAILADSVSRMAIALAIMWVLDRKATLEERYLLKQHPVKPLPLCRFCPLVPADLIQEYAEYVMDTPSKLVPFVC